MKKWEFTGEEKEVCGLTLRRIRAAVTFELRCGIKIEAGENGGWIEKEENLSGDAWVSDNAWVYGDALVSDNAWVYGDALVYGNAWVSDNAWVYGDALVYGNARVSGNAWVYGDARVSGDAQVYGNARASGNARVSGNAWVYGDARVSGDAWVSGNAHYFQIGPAGSRNDYTIFTRNKAGTIYVSCGCFFGTIAEFRERVKQTHGDNKHARVYLAAATLAEMQIDTTPIEDEPPKEDNADADGA